MRKIELYWYSVNDYDGDFCMAYDTEDPFHYWHTVAFCFADTITECLENLDFHRDVQTWDYIPFDCEDFDYDFVSAIRNARENEDIVIDDNTTVRVIASHTITA